MDYIYVHPFDLERQDMILIQNELRKKIRKVKLEKKPSIVSGVDVTYKEGIGTACIVTVDVSNMQILEVAIAQRKVEFAYETGLLAFREIPIFLKAWQLLKIRPDVVIFDGNGLLHERRMGLATQASFWIGLPTIGVSYTR